jgi:tRNA (mo5U34)-methyltransferase
MLGEMTPDSAREFMHSTTFLWHQRFELAPGVLTPGTSNVAFLLDRAGVPADLSGRTVLDVGTTNGGAAFEAERRGASRVVAVDIYPPDRFGFAELAQFCRSQVEFLQATVYELPELLREQFDLVLFFGVLYHLRHPLLALDRLRELARDDIAIESAVCDFEQPLLSKGAYVRFYRGAELGNDSSNWFAPSVTALREWVTSCGFAVEAHEAWPSEAPSRAMVRAKRTSAAPEYITLSYEQPITSVRVQNGGRV